jgi:hypothetical protein
MTLKISPHLVKKKADSAPTGATYPLHTDAAGHYLHHPQQGRLEVVALYCNCGRSIFVEAEAAPKMAVTCDRCRSAFLWQQLSFADWQAAA